MPYSNDIKERLQKKKMTQAELAELCDVNESYISEIINGKRTGIKLSMAFKIASVLGARKIEDVFKFEK